MDTKADIEKLAEDFASCQKVLTALGDENRQYLILEMMKKGILYGTGAWDKDDIYRHPAFEKAYETGKSI